MALRIAVPAAMSAAATAIVIVVVVTRPRAREAAFVVARRHGAAAAIVVLVTRPRAHEAALIVAAAIVVAITATRTATFFPAVPRRLRVTFGIAVPAAMPTTATPVIIILVIVVTRPRAGEPAFIVACRHRAATIIIAIAAAGTFPLVPAAT